MQLGAKGLHSIEITHAEGIFAQVINNEISEENTGKMRLLVSFSFPITQMVAP